MNEYKRDRRYFSPSHKMGFKILDELQMRNVFPTVNNLTHKFEVHRNKIKEIQEIRKEGIDFQYNLMYDSIYSIWGKRGSGKTSVIFTLKYMLENKGRENLVLPVIMPEMIPQGCDIMTWLMAVLDDEIKQLEEIIEHKKNLVNDNDFFRYCMFNPNNRLRTAYNKVKELCYSRACRTEDESYEINIGNAEMYTQNSFDFAKELAAFWDIMIETIRKAYDIKKEYEPLIFIMFDDVDLTPEKVMELFSVIIKYLSHPNLIVITTADEELLHAVVEKDLGRKIGADILKDGLQKVALSMAVPWETISQIVNEIQGESDRQKFIKETANLYLAKVLPPSERYYLEVFDTCEKKMAFIEKMETGEKIDKPVNIETFLRDQVNRLRFKLCGKCEDLFDNFLYYSKNSSTFLESYLIFWGTTSRQLVNQCFIVENLIEQMINCYTNSDLIKDNNERQQYIKTAVYQQLHLFLYNTMNTNRELMDEYECVADFAECLLNFQKDQWDLYFNYNYLVDMFERKAAGASTANKKAKQLTNTVKLMLLLMFMENLVLMPDKLNPRYSMSDKRNRVHGISQLVYLLDRMVKDDRISLIKRGTDGDVSEVLYLFGNLIKNPQKILNFKMYHFFSVQDYLYAMLYKNLGKEIECADLERWSRENPIWFETFAKMLYLMYQNVFSLERGALKDVNLNESLMPVDNYSRKLFNRMQTKDGKKLLKQELYGNDRKKAIREELEKFMNIMQSVKGEIGYKPVIVDRDYISIREIDRGITETVKNILEKDADTDRQAYQMAGVCMGLLDADEWCATLSELISEVVHKEKDDLLEMIRKIMEETKKKVYVTAFQIEKYYVTNKEKFEEAVTGLTDAEKKYGDNCIYAYAKVQEEIWRQYNPDSLEISAAAMSMLKKQAKETSDRIVDSVTMSDRECFLNIHGWRYDIEDNFELAARNKEEYNILEQYVILMRLLEYFADIYSSLYLQQQAYNSTFYSEGYEKTFCYKVYQQMLNTVKAVGNREKAVNYMRVAKQGRIQYYLGSMLARYFEEAGDAYIQRLEETRKQ